MNAGDAVQTRKPAARGRERTDFPDTLAIAGLAAFFATANRPFGAGNRTETIGFSAISAVPFKVVGLDSFATPVLDFYSSEIFKKLPFKVKANGV